MQKIQTMFNRTMTLNDENNDEQYAINDAKMLSREQTEYVQPKHKQSEPSNIYDPSKQTLYTQTSAPIYYSTPQQIAYVPPSAPPETTSNDKVISSNNTNNDISSSSDLYQQRMQKIQAIENKVMAARNGYHDDDDGNWSQTQQNAKGTYPPQRDFDEKHAINDAKILRQAMKGMGCDKHKIVNITGNRNNSERQMIKKVFVNIDKIIHNNSKCKKRHLLTDIMYELKGDLKKLVIACYTNKYEYDARLISDTFSFGAMFKGFDDDLLIEILCTRTNKQINNIKKAWNEILKKPKSIEFEIKKDTKHNGNFGPLMLGILEGKRALNMKPNINKIKQSAHDLYQWIYIQQRSKSECKEFLFDIFIKYPWSVIAIFYEEYDKISAKYTLNESIKKYLVQEIQQKQWE